MRRLRQRENSIWYFPPARSYFRRCIFMKTLSWSNVEYSVEVSKASAALSDATGMARVDCTHVREDDLHFISFIFLIAEADQKSTLMPLDARASLRI